MSTLKSWEDFLEPMEHEIKDCSMVLGVDAYRVDDCKGKFDGIRTHCNIRNPENNQKVKTCDYFYIVNEKFLCIEFSDLSAQKSKRDESINKIKKIGIDRSEWINILENSNSDSIISNELFHKIVDTDFILRNLYNGNYNTLIANPPNENHSKHFFIIYFLPNSSEIDKARLSDSYNDEFKNVIAKLKSKLATLPLQYVNSKEIYWLEIHTFQEIYCN